jgi:hypothetical protein
VLARIFTHSVRASGRGARSRPCNTLIVPGGRQLGDGGVLARIFTHSVRASGRGPRGMEVREKLFGGGEEKRSRFHQTWRESPSGSEAVEKWV